MRIRTARSIALSAIAVFGLAGPALAQSNPDDAPAARTTSPSDRPDTRFIQQFITDARIVDKQWYGIEARFLRGAVPPLENADGFLLTPTIAISPFRDLEVGGQVSYIDFDLDEDINDHGGESGLGDLTVWGKYRILHGDVEVSAGMALDLPTGSEDDGLGTGKVVPALFGSVRGRVGEGSVIGHLGLRFNRDATILDENIEGKTSTFLGGGYMWEPARDLAVSGEITVESERFNDLSSDIRLTAGVQWLGLGHSVLRGGLSAGLSDAAPDFEVIFGYAYTF